MPDNVRSAVDAVAQDRTNVGPAMAFDDSTGANPPLVETRNVARRYRQSGTTVDALISATCAVFPGDRIALVGPSGSGKSTLLHLLGGLDDPTAGDVIWPGLGGRKTLRPLKVAFVFQVPSLLPALSVFENVELPLLLGLMDPDTARTAARTALDRLHLMPFAGALPEELSGGQAQRVAIARAVACRPRLLLADEPTGQLDRATADQVLDALFDMLTGTSTALVIATHDRNIAERLDTTWSMHHGRLDVTPC